MMNKSRLAGRKRHRLRRRGNPLGEDGVKTEYRRAQRDIILLAIEPFSGSPRRLSLDFLLTLCLFFIGVRELRLFLLYQDKRKERKRNLFN
jgi:hypothetical protein